MILTLLLLVFSNSSQALNMDVILDALNEPVAEKPVDPFPNKAQVEKEMQAIFMAMSEGQVPLVGAQTEFFYGSCITYHSASATPPVFTATLALREGLDGGLDINYTTGQGVIKNYTLADHGNYLEKMYIPKVRPSKAVTSEAGGVHLDYTMAAATPSFPEVHAFLSMDKDDADLVYFIAPLTGHYCKLQRIR